MAKEMIYQTDEGEIIPVLKLEKTPEEVSREADRKVEIERDRAEAIRLSKLTCQPVEDDEPVPKIAADAEKKAKDDLEVQESSQ